MKYLQLLLGLILAFCSYDVGVVEAKSVTASFI